MAAQCPLCTDFSAPTLKYLLIHINRVHSHDPNFRISCGILGCQAVYRNFRCFKQHLKRKHPDQLETQVGGPETQSNSTTSYTSGIA